MKAALYLLATIVALAALFVVFKPDDAAQALRPAPAPGAGTTVAEKVPAPAPSKSSVAVASFHTIDLVIRKSALFAGPAVTRVAEGDEVLLRITSDAADELHLHGYNLSARLQPGQRTTLQFVASRSGRFPYELHRTHADLGAIEVYPR